MKKYAFCLILFAASLTGCKETDIDLFDSPLTEVGTGTLSAGQVTVSSLAFSWSPIDGVIQYGYALYDPDRRVVRQGVTKDTEISFERLEPATTYSLEVEAYGANNAMTQKFSLSAATDPVITLDAPDVAAITTTLANGVLTISWPDVQGADYYDYVLITAKGEEVESGTVTVSEVSFAGLELGKYMLSLQALSDYEGYLDSQIATYPFTREREVLKAYEGVYESYMLGSYPCTMKHYGDGTYSIEAFYGVEGYNLEFSIDEDTDALTILNYYSRFGKYVYVSTGLEDDYAVTIYEDPDYCVRYDNEDGTHGIALYLFLGADALGGYDYFEYAD